MARLIEDKYKEWEAECEKRLNQLKANEEELNSLFIDICGRSTWIYISISDHLFGFFL